MRRCRQQWQQVTAAWVAGRLARLRWLLLQQQQQQAAGRSSSLQLVVLL
jgi:hypothetical protein